MRAGRILLATCLLVLVCPLAEAEDDWFRYRVERPTVNALLSGELQSSESKSGDSGSKRDITTTIEKLGINTEGWIYHPALLEFKAGLQPEFQQRHTEQSQGGGDRATGTFLGFDVDAMVLPYKPYTLDLYARQDRSRNKSIMTNEQTSDSSTYRARLRLKEYWMPTSFTLETRDRISTSFYTSHEKTDLAKVESQHRSATSQTRLDAEFQDRATGTLGNETSSQQATLRARNLYRPDKYTNSNTAFNHTLNQYGDSSSTTSNLSSGLSLQHHEKLSSNYQFDLENRSEQGFNSSNGQVAAVLQHQLYDNLTTSLNGNLSKGASTSGKQDDYGAALDLNYYRPTSWGRVNANTGRAEQGRDWQRVLTDIQIRNEAYTITSDPVTGVIELRQLDIDPATIKVWNTGRSLQYTEGIDYSVATVGRNVILTWSLLPGLGDPALGIVVDYSHVGDPSAKTRTISDRFGAGVNLWSVLGFRYNWNQSRTELLSGTFGSGDTQDRATEAFSASLNLGSDKFRSSTDAGTTQTKIAPDKLAGGRGEAIMTNDRLRQVFRVGKWSSTSFEVEDITLGGDRRASSRSPTLTRRARQLLIFQPMPRMSLSGGANYSNVYYKETGDYNVSSGYDARMRWLVGGGTFEANAFSKERRSRQDETWSMGIEMSYQWQFGPWEPSARFSLTEDTRPPRDVDPGSRSTQTMLYFEIRRMFF